jgi:hypothetical protein
MAQDDSAAPLQNPAPRVDNDASSSTRGSRCFSSFSPTTHLNKIGCGWREALANHMSQPALESATEACSSVMSRALSRLAEERKLSTVFCIPRTNRLKHHSSRSDGCDEYSSSPSVTMCYAEAADELLSGCPET